MKVIIIHHRFLGLEIFNDVEIHGEDNESFYIRDKKYLKSQIVKIEIYP